MARLSFRLLLAAAVGFALLAGVVGRVSDYPFGTCTEPGLPITLDSVAYLGFDGDMTIHGDYLMNVSKPYEEIAFALNQDSWMRVYVAPHVVDVNLKLYDPVGGVVSATATFGTEESLFVDLPASGMPYRLQVSYDGDFLYDPNVCETMTFELAIVPKDTAANHLASQTCSGTKVPTIDTSLANGAIDIDTAGSGTTYSVANPPVSDPDAVTFVHGYQFTVPADGPNELWTIEARLGYNFLLGGSLRLVINEGGVVVEPDFPACHVAGSCTLGIDQAENIHVVKELLRAGSTYTLWIMDAAGRHPDISCMVFDLAVLIDVVNSGESFVNCQARRVPSTLDGPGYLYPSSRMHLTDDMFLDLETGYASTTFTIIDDSFLRVYVAAHDRVDVDLILEDDDGAIVASAYNDIGYEEGITYLLTPGAYELSFEYSGDLSDVHFCETFALELAIALVDDDAGDHCKKRSLGPDLDDMDDALAGGDGSYHFQIGKGDRDFALPYDGDWNARAFYTHNFTVVQPVHFELYVHSRFVYGDIEAWVIPLHDGEAAATGQRILGERMQNTFVLNEELAVGPHMLVVALAATQYEEIDMGHDYPECADYTFYLDVVPLATRQNATVCATGMRLPGHLNSIRFQASKDVYHWAGDVFLPQQLSFGSDELTQTTSFHINADSVFRIYLEPDRFDIDLELYDDEGVLQEYSWGGQGDTETIVFRVEKGMDYELVFVYYRNQDADMDDNPCETFRLEFMSEPVEDIFDATCSSGSATALPETLTVPTNLGTVLDDVFAFEQGAAPVELTTTFTVEGGDVYLRAVAEFSFVFDDVVLSITSAEEGAIAVGGSVGFNTNDISSVYLPPGTYTLHVAEPVAYDDASLRHCARFHLIVEMTTFQPLDVFRDDFWCAKLPMPASFNSVAYLSPSGGNRLTWQREVLVSQYYDQVAINIETETLFRFYTPTHPTTDVDVFLVEGTKNNPGNMVASGYSFEAEMLEALLAPGDYVLELFYFDQIDGWTEEDAPSLFFCEGFVAEIAFLPTSTIAHNPVVSTDDCPVSTVPSSLRVGAPQLVKAYTRPYNHSGTYRRDITFEVDQAAFARFHVRYDFATSAMKMLLNGFETSFWDPIGYAFSEVAKVDYGHEYIHVALGEGTYTLTLLDDTDAAVPVPALDCQPFELALELVPEEALTSCDDAQLLPSNLYDYDGGSVPYGGPQDPETGAVRIYGVHFEIPVDASNNHPAVFYFKVMTRSYVRVYAHPEFDDESDIDLYIFNGTSPDALSFEDEVAASLSTREEETVLALIDPADEPYTVVLDYWDRSDADCEHLAFEFELQPVEVVAAELACPDTLPAATLPPQVFTAHGGEQVSYFRDDLYLTSALLADYFNHTNSRRYKYNIEIQVDAPATIAAGVGFDFLANSFRLQLVDVANTFQVIASGVADGAIDRDSYISFRNDLEASVPSGTYMLTIIEASPGTPFGALDEYCHQFSFSLEVSTEYAAHVVSVEPAGGFNLDPTVDLVLTIRLSEPIASPSRADFQEFAVDNNLAYLSTATRPVIRPAAISPGPKYDELRVIFDAGSLRYDEVYTFTFLAERLTGSNGTFTSLVDSPQYMTTNCHCYGHGHCDAPTDDVNVFTDSLSCTCDYPYTGPHCLACSGLFHLAGEECVDNTYCLPMDGDCSGHGTCDDSEGYPICTCDSHFVTDGTNECAVCADGYVMSGNVCQEETSDLDGESDVCKYTLLPYTLDGVGYLGYDGTLHAHDDFFVDLAHSHHTMTFTLFEDTMARVTVAPDQVDVDVFVQQGAGDNAQIIEYGINAGGEDETLFGLLEGSPTGTDYTLTFTYNTAATYEYERCEAMQMEAAFMPVDDAANLANWLNADCQPHGASRLPTFEPPMPINAPDGFLFGEEVEDGDEQIWSVVSSSTSPHVDDAGRYWFYSVTFNVTNSGDPDMVPHLFTSIGYDFLLGGLGMLLEDNTEVATPDHCASATGAEKLTRCMPGYGKYNGDSIDMDLLPGRYTLWLFEPVHQATQLTNCAPFSFNFEVSYRDREPAPLDCGGINRLPATLADPGYIDADGYIHIEERFLVETAGSYAVRFDIDEASLFRAYVPIHAVDIDLLLRQLGKAGVIASSSADNTNEDSIFVALDPGSYLLNVRFSAGFDYTAGECESFHFELAIAPTALFDDGPLNCPRDDVPPVVDSNTILQLPVSIGERNNLIKYYAGSESGSAFPDDGVVTSLRFAVDDTAHLMAAVASDFLRAGLSIRVQGTLDDNDANGRAVTVTLTGTHDLNRHFVDLELEPGVYTLEIVRDGDYRAGIAGLADCIPYNFFMSASVLVSDDGDSATGEGDDGCPPGRPIPVSFNTEEYLGLTSNGRMHVQDARWEFKTPHYYEQTLTTVTVARPSLLRLYTEPTADVDVDLNLLDRRNPGDILARKILLFEEESLTYILEPGVPYIIALQYYLWEANVVVSCPRLNMEVSILPLDEEDADAPLCPNEGADQWPQPTPTALPLINGAVFEYSSTANAGETLYIQQRFNEPRSHVLGTFYAARTFRLHAEVGYDFARSDLVLTLVENNSGTVLSGINWLNRNVLSEDNLPIGNYSLVLHEPAEVSAGTALCSYYTFYLYVDSQAGGDGSVGLGSLNRNRLPASLDTVPYLRYHDFHFEDEFHVDTGDFHGDTISFTLDYPALFRMYTEPSLIDVDFVVRNASAAWEDIGFVALSIAAYGEDALALRLEPGRYNVHVQYGRSAGHDYPDINEDFTYELEMATLSAAAVSKAIAKLPTTCPDTGIPPATVDPNGVYQYSANALTVSAATMAAQDEVAFTEFEVDTFSLVYAQIEYDFVLNDLVIEIDGVSYGVDGTPYPITEAFIGRKSLNSNMLYVTVPPGRWNITVRQPARIPKAWAHCLVYDFDIRIEPFSYGGNHAICHETEVLPWTLDRPSDKTAVAVSAAYGGPILSDGSLIFYGDNFLMGSNGDSVQFTVASASLVGVTLEPASGSLDLYLFDTGGAGDNDITPLSPARYAEEGGRTEYLFYLDHASTYAMYLAYTGTPATEACPTLAVGVNMQSAVEAQRDALCPEPANAVLPATTLTIDASGYGGDSVFSHWPSTEPLLASDGYQVKFQLTEASIVTAQLAYDALVSDFGVMILSGWDEYAYDFGEAQAGTLFDASGRTNTERTLTYALTEGYYSLLIFEASSTLLTNTFKRDYCFPFSWSVHVFPYYADEPVVEAISPPGGIDLPASEPIVLEVWFSEPLFDGTGKPIGKDTWSEVRAAFTLVDSGSGTAIHPSVAGDGFIYTLTFAPDRNAVTYQLEFHSGFLYNASRGAVRMSPERTYTYAMLDTTCSGFGYVPDMSDTGRCTCFTGYTGVDCSVCDFGFYNPSKASPPVCIARSESGSSDSGPATCEIDTCYCMPDNPEYCEPRGSCSIEDGEPVCACSELYTGARCQYCADPSATPPFCTAHGAIGTTAPTEVEWTQAETIMRTGGFVTGLAVILGAAALMVFRRRKNYTRLQDGGELETDFRPIQSGRPGTGEPRGDESSDDSLDARIATIGGLSEESDSGDILLTAEALRDMARSSAAAGGDSNPPPAPWGEEGGDDDRSFFESTGGGDDAESDANVATIPSPDPTPLEPATIVSGTPGLLDLGDSDESEGDISL